MNRIRDLRKEAELSQHELARKFNLSQQTISSYENGTREPDNKTLKQLAQFFDVSVDYLLGHSEVRKNNELISETGASYSLDISDLPEDAVKQVEEYLDFIRQRYNNERDKKK